MPNAARRPVTVVALGVLGAAVAAVYLVAGVYLVGLGGLTLVGHVDGTTADKLLVLALALLGAAVFLPLGLLAGWGVRQIWAGHGFAGLHSASMILAGLSGFVLLGAGAASFDRDKPPLIVVVAAAILFGLGFSAYRLARTATVRSWCRQRRRGPALVSGAVRTRRGVH